VGVKGTRGKESHINTPHLISAMLILRGHREHDSVRSTLSTAMFDVELQDLVGITSIPARFIKSFWATTRDAMCRMKSCLGGADDWAMTPCGGTGIRRKRGELGNLELRKRKPHRGRVVARDLHAKVVCLVDLALGTVRRMSKSNSQMRPAGMWDT